METLNALVAFGTDFSLEQRLATTLAGDLPVSYTFCENGKQALGRFLDYQWDLCVIYENLPLISGFQLTRKIRRQNEVVPLIFITENGRPEPAYRAGADIVLPSNFNTQIFSYRAAAVIKRCLAHPLQAVLQIGSIILNLSAAILTCIDSGIEIALTPRQAGVLNLLLTYPNQTIRRAEILRAVWQKDSYFNGRSMDVIINKLRSKLAPLQNIAIETIHGIGFRMSI